MKTVWLDGKPYREPMAEIVYKLTLPPLYAYEELFTRDYSTEEGEI